MGAIKYHHLLLFTVVIILLFSSCDVDGASRRKSSSSSRRRATVTSRRRSSSGSRSTVQNRPKIYSYTPMKATSYGSPIIRQQAKPRSSFNRGLIGGAVAYYALSRAPLYRGNYPLFYRSHVHIPDNRAIRLWREELVITNSYGERCLNTSKVSGYNYSSTEDKHFNSSRITVDYGHNKISGSENITLDASRKGDNITVTSQSEYNEPVIPRTNCTRVTVTTTFTMVEMYETNPNGCGVVKGSFTAVFMICLMLELIRRR